MYSRAELESGRLVWLLALQIRGRVYRFATAPVQVANATASQGPPVMQYLGGLEFLEYDDTIGLFDSEASAREVSISVLFQQGQTEGWDAVADPKRDIGEATGELSLYLLGEDYGTREIIVDGYLGSPTHGSRNEPVAFTLSESDWTDRALLPPRAASVRKATWPQTTASGHDMRRDDKAKRQPYPWVFGNPGKYSPGDWWGKGSGCMPMTPALIVKIDTTDENNITEPATLLLAGHPIHAAGAVKIYNETRGRWFTVTPAITADSQLQAVTTATVTAGGAGATTYIEPGDALWVAWTVAGGVPVVEETGPATGAGDVIEYLLRRSRLRVDTFKARSVLQEVNAFEFDFWFNEPRAPLDVIKDDLLPHLPISPQIRHEGLGFCYWNWAATAADAVDSIDAGRDLADRLTEVEVSSVDDVYNVIQINYCQDGPEGDFRKRMTYAAKNPTDDPDIITNPYSFASWTRYGKREGLEIDCPVVEQDDTARAILDWKIRYHSVTHRTVSYQMPQTWQAREVGDVVTVTDASIGWASVVCLITAIVRVPGSASVTFTTVGDWPRDLIK